MEEFLVYVDRVEPLWVRYGKGGGWGGRRGVIRSGGHGVRLFRIQRRRVYTGHVILRFWIGHVRARR